MLSWQTLAVLFTSLLLCIFVNNFHLQAKELGDAGHDDEAMSNVARDNPEADSDEEDDEDIAEDGAKQSPVRTPGGNSRGKGQGPQGRGRGPKGRGAGKDSRLRIGR